jgi:uncharacterized membrane protein (UPF0127 family)
MIGALVLAGAGCASSSGNATGASSIPPSPTVTIGSIVPHVGPRAPLDGFREITVTVKADDGTTHEWCLLLADTEPLRARGLMEVTDPALGGYDGMVFAFDQDERVGFWMKNTILPLSIAFLRADGTPVSIFDMEPCPADAATCPTYPAGGPYRNAIEVPKGQLARLGITSSSTVTLGDESCASVPVATAPPAGSTDQR